MASYAKPLARRKPHAQEHEDPRELLMHDPLPRGQMNAMVMESMHETTPIFWVVTAILAAIAVYTLGYDSYGVIMPRHGVTGELRPHYWGAFRADTALL